MYSNKFNMFVEKVVNEEIMEEGIQNLKYYYPPAPNYGKRLDDFYSATFLDSYMDRSNIDREDQVVIDEIIGTVINETKKWILNELRLSCVGEMRHAMEQSDLGGYGYEKATKILNLDKQEGEWLFGDGGLYDYGDNDYVSKLTARRLANSDSAPSADAQMSIALKLFRDIPWEEEPYGSNNEVVYAYGGPNWAKIAQSYFDIRNAGNNQPKVVMAIDHAIDLTHNGNESWLEKGMTENEYEKVKDVLDRKREARSILFLEPSSAIKKLLHRFLPKTMKSAEGGYYTIKDFKEELRKKLGLAISPSVSYTGMNRADISGLPDMPLKTSSRASLLLYPVPRRDYVAIQYAFLENLDFNEKEQMQKDIAEFVDWLKARPTKPIELKTFDITYNKPQVEESKSYSNKFNLFIENVISDEIVEEGIQNLKYYYPPDPERLDSNNYDKDRNSLNNYGKRIDDFYSATFLDSYMDRSNIDKEDLEVADEIIKTVIDKTKEWMLKELWLSCVGELRHVGEHSDILVQHMNSQGLVDGFDATESIWLMGIDSFTNRNELRSALKARESQRLKKDYYSMEDERGVLRNAAISQMTPSSQMSVARKAFNDFKWDEAYGGKAWGKIAQSYFDIENAKSTPKLIAAIDHSIDLTHNGDESWLEKGMDHSTYQRLTKVLDRKRNAATIWALEPSSAIKKLLQRLLPKNMKQKDTDAVYFSEEDFFNEFFKYGPKAGGGNTVIIPIKNTNMDNHNPISYGEPYIQVSVILYEGDINKPHAIVHPTNTQRLNFADKGKMQKDVKDFFEWLTSGSTEIKDFETFNIKYINRYFISDKKEEFEGGEDNKTTKFSHSDLVEEIMKYSIKGKGTIFLAGLSYIKPIPLIPHTPTIKIVPMNDYHETARTALHFVGMNNLRGKKSQMQKDVYVLMDILNLHGAAPRNGILPKFETFNVAFDGLPKRDINI